LLEWKGVHIALHSLHLARDAGHNVHLTVIGDGPGRDRLQRLSRELGLDSAVEWAGHLPQAQLAAYYDSADVLLFPSLRDSGGMVVLEALAHGLPVIGTDLGGPGQIVDQSCGYTIATHGRTREELTQDIARTLGELISCPELLASLSRGARLRARQFQFADLVRSVYRLRRPHPWCVPHDQLALTRG
jgi:glycosyltransferase involved in cell wall biosynthesis